MAYSFFEGTLGVIIFWLVGMEQIEEKIGPLITALKKHYQNGTEEEERMFKGIEDGAIANIMTSIDEFKTKYLN